MLYRLVSIDAGKPEAGTRHDCGMAHLHAHDCCRGTWIWNTREKKNNKFGVLYTYRIHAGPELGDPNAGDFEVWLVINYRRWRCLLWSKSRCCSSNRWSFFFRSLGSGRPSTPPIFVYVSHVRLLLSDSDTWCMLFKHRQARTFWQGMCPVRLNLIGCTYFKSLENRRRQNFKVKDEEKEEEEERLKN